MHYWIDNEILTWNSIVDDSRPQFINDRHRPYKHWKHANNLLQQHCTEFTLIDILTTLWRSVSLRLKHLNDIYRFKKIPIATKPSGLLEIMEYFEIIRPLMLNKLKDIRNVIEHEDKNIPDIDICRELSEFVWYFLRSTDPLAMKSVGLFTLNRGKFSKEIENQFKDMPINDLTFLIDIKRNWNIGISGNIETTFLSYTSLNDWILVSGTIKRNTFEEIPVPKNTIMINGDIRGPSEIIYKIITLYFSLAFEGHHKLFSFLL